MVFELRLLKLIAGVMKSYLSLLLCHSPVNNQTIDKKARWNNQPPHQSDRRFGVVNVQADA